MKKLIAIICALALSLTGCAELNNEPKNTIDYSDTYVEGQDSQENFIGSDCGGYYASLDGSYYFVDNGFLFVVDKNTKKCIPFCNKSDCLHDKEPDSDNRQKCMAYLGVTDPNSTVIAYNGNLYYQSTVEETDRDGFTEFYDGIYRLSPSTGEREVIFRTNEYFICGFKVHRGYVYMKAVKFTKNSHSASGDDADIIRFPVDGSDPEPETIIKIKEYRKKYKDAFVSEFRFYGNHLFIDLDYLDGNEGKDIFLNYELTKNKIYNMEEELNVNHTQGITIYNDKLFFRDNESQGIYQCDLNGDNCEKVMDVTELVKDYTRWLPLTNDGDNLIITVCKPWGDGKLPDYSNNLIFCDKNYKTTVKKVPFKHAYASIGFDKSCFLVYSDNKLWWIDKATMKKKKIYEFNAKLAE